MTDTFKYAPEADHVQTRPETDEYGRIVDIHKHRLLVQVECTRITVGEWDDYGVRVLTFEADSYATVELRVPTALPFAWASQLATFATQHIPYTDRDRAWDAETHGGITSERDHWNCFVDSVLAALTFARSAVESAVRAHARDEDWNWSYAVPGRVEDKYEKWGDDHPLLYDFYGDFDHPDAAAEERAHQPGQSAPDDVEF